MDDSQNGGMREARAALCTCLRANRDKLERTIVAELAELPRSATTPSSDDLAGIEPAVSVGVAHCIENTELELEESGPIPALLLQQAGKAAHCGVELELLLRRYLVAYALYCDHLIQAAQEAAPMHENVLRSAMRGQAILLERALLGVIDVYRREQGDRTRPERRLAGHIRQLLAGDLLAPQTLEYDLDHWHVAAIAGGSDMEEPLRRFARTSDRQLLLVKPEAGIVWAWLGGRRRIATEEIVSRISAQTPAGAVVAIGEPARGIEGWRLTHRQAEVAWTMAHGVSDHIITYSEVGLLASVSHDQLLARSLRQLYLAPLAKSRDGGAVLRKTLRAYFSAGGNTSSAASALGISRQTVRSRLRTVEERLDRTLESCAPELQLALKLAALDESATTLPHGGSF